MYVGGKRVRFKDFKLGILNFNFGGIRIFKLVDIFLRNCYEVWDFNMYRGVVVFVGLRILLLESLEKR